MSRLIGSQPQLQVQELRVFVEAHAVQAKLGAVEESRIPQQGQFVLSQWIGLFGKILTGNQSDFPMKYMGLSGSNCPLKSIDWGVFQPIFGFCLSHWASPKSPWVSILTWSHRCSKKGTVGFISFPCTILPYLSIIIHHYQATILFFYFPHGFVWK